MYLQKLIEQEQTDKLLFRNRKAKIEKLPSSTRIKPLEQKNSGKAKGK